MMLSKHKKLLKGFTDSIIQMNAGDGVWGKAFHDIGIHAICFTPKPPELVQYPVAKGDFSKLQHDRTLLMTESNVPVVKAYEGSKVIYIGEWGTGHVMFFKYLDEHFKFVEGVPLDEHNQIYLFAVPKMFHCLECRKPYRTLTVSHRICHNCDKKRDNVAGIQEARILDHPDHYLGDHGSFS